MPLIIITGTPCSGKTYRARQILDDFKSRIDSSPSLSPARSVVYIPSHHAHLDPSDQDSGCYNAPAEADSPRDLIYDSARLEKTARAEEFSAIKRAVNKNTVVIADAPNYIKGFRYQLFCEAKAAGTRSVVLHAAAREDECVQWNNARREAWGWATTDMEASHTNTEQGSISGPKIGRDVRGELEPESHTAIYGDKVTNGTRSRTSSTGAAMSDDDDSDENEAETRKRKVADDTMTLKSLYITDRSQPHAEEDTTQPTQSFAASAQTQKSLSDSTPPTPQSSLPYAPSTLRSLFMRYEPPSPFTRWDTPLFTIPSTDAHPPYDQIWDSIFPAPTRPTSKKALLQEQHELQRQSIPTAKATNPTTTSFAHQNRPQPQTAAPPATVPSIKQNASTTLPSATAPNALQTLERTTNDITKLVLAAARAANVAEGEDHAILTIVLPAADGDGDSEDLELQLEKPEGVALSQPKLQRMRRKFGQMQRGGIAHGQGHMVGRRAVAGEFARFLEGEWLSEGML